MAPLTIIVTDIDSGIGLQFVSVTVNRIASATNADGIAQFDVPPGPYLAQIRSQAHQSKDMRVQAPGEHNIGLKYTLFT